MHKVTVVEEDEETVYLVESPGSYSARKKVIEFCYGPGYRPPYLNVSCVPIDESDEPYRAYTFNRKTGAIR